MMGKCFKEKQTIAVLKGAEAGMPLGDFCHFHDNRAVRQRRRSHRAASQLLEVARKLDELLLVIP